MFNCFNWWVNFFFTPIQILEIFDCALSLKMKSLTFNARLNFKANFSFFKSLFFFSEGESNTGLDQCCLKVTLFTNQIKIWNLLRLGYRSLNHSGFWFFEFSTFVVIDCCGLVLQVRLAIHTKWKGTLYYFQRLLFRKEFIF